MDAQLKKGLLDVCVLVALQERDSYGYQIIKDVNPIVEISESTLYPILKRLEAGGFVTTYSMEHNSRLRKYYHLTDRGRERIGEFLVEWQDVMRAYRYIAASQEGGATPLRKDETP
ncbi:MAG TPA: PadR family transcriptional regulator [Candidatus Acutalibacter pullicola]|uniref:PadR family transcriptional regulator n=1 Tax=Candidatus Acutalibacter pullicola TaxID=2838417 RepID=A0A9D2MVA7_9FIRM|nr:PadR family transcriptional regulator [Candidatus Acutalibacter pullicola]